MENTEYLTSINIDELNQMINELNILQTFKKNQNKACKTYYEKNKEKLKQRSREYYEKIKLTKYNDEIYIQKRREYSKKHYNKHKQIILDKRKEIRDNEINNLYLDNLNANI